MLPKVVVLSSSLITFVAFAMGQLSQTPHPTGSAGDVATGPSLEWWPHYSKIHGMKVYKVGGLVASPGPIRLSTDVMRPAPGEPEGRVVIWAIIDEHGAVRYPRVVTGLTDRENHQALEAVKEWNFKPAQKQGVNVAVETNLTIKFSR